MDQKKPIPFPTYNVSLPQACAIVKDRLDDPDIPQTTKVLAIRRVTEMETHNSITKADMLRMLRWIFNNCDIKGE